MGAAAGAQRDRRGCLRAPVDGDGAEEGSATQRAGDPAKVDVAARGEQAREADGHGEPEVTTSVPSEYRPALAVSQKAT
ncbi:hypothetical protein DNL40_09570 [Xylanimonas oleitrophica]|uniref:Uncharacterized protein n=1 Tax=Xylanimonas oleitrophica TaxID=2607479 RepID=A0A2W5WMY8_9MICO|nr:hypothetical protein DNL40_09570 [Xylanimonas oleitrophica]